MKMEKSDYKDALAALPSGVLDGLRRIVEFVDNALTQEHRRDVHFQANKFWDESSFLGSLFGELTSDPTYARAKEVQGLLQDDWQIFFNDGKGVLQLQYDNYATLKMALKDVLRQQPFGYERNLERPAVKPQVKVVSKDGVVYLQFGEERPIRIAGAKNKQGKLLRLLGNPIGASRTIESVSEELDGDMTTMQNAMKEIQSKLATKQKPRTLRLGFSETAVWIETL